MVSMLEAMQRMSVAEGIWLEALEQHATAEPNALFAERLRETADAAAQQRIALEEIDRQGLVFEPFSADEIRPLPYELRSLGRVGPAVLWERFDEAHEEWMSVLQGERSFAAIAEVFGRLADVLAELADAVDRERGVDPEQDEGRRSATESA